MKKGLLIAASVIGALMLSVVFVSALIDATFFYQITLSRILVLLISAAVIFGLLQLVKCKKLAATFAKRELLYLVGFFAVLVLAQLFIYKFIAIYQKGWDIETTFRAAGLAAEGRLTEGLRYYLTQFPNNFGVTMFMGAWFKLTSWLPVGWTVRALTLNLLSINVSILLVYLSVRALRGTAAAIKSTWLALLFSPFFLYLPVFYTDTLSMPFAIGLVCAYIYLKCAERQTQRYLLAGVMGLLAVFAFALKPTALIVLVAIVIYELLTLKMSGKAARFSWRRIASALKIPAVFAVVAVPCLIFFATAQNMAAKEGVDALPWQNYVMMGAGGNGGFSRTDRDAVLRQLDFEGVSGAEVAEQSWTEFKRRLSDFGPLGYANFLLHKMSYTWGDGTFYAPDKLARFPVSTENGGSKTWLQQIVLPEGKFFKPFLYVQNGFWVAVLFIFAVGACRDIRAFGGNSAKGKEEQGEFSVGAVKFILRLSLLGVILFFLVWETRSRYIVNYTPIFVLLLALELQDLFQGKSRLACPEGVGFCRRAAEKTVGCLRRRRR